MENEVIWKTLLGARDDSSTKDDVTSTDPALYPEYRAGEKPTTADPQKSKADLRIGANLAGEVFTPRLKKAPTGSTDAQTGLKPIADAMRELAEELRHFRQRMKTVSES